MGCQSPPKLLFLHVFCLPINGPKDAKMCPVRGFALHPEDVLPTNMDFNHSIFTIEF